MSVVVAIVEDDRVVLACDSQVSAGKDKYYLNNSENCKIWTYDGSPNLVVGGVGSAKVMQLVKTANYLKGVNPMMLTYEAIIQGVIPLLLEDLKNNDGVIRSNNVVEIESDFFFAVQNKLYHLSGYDMFLCEENKWAAMGSGMNAAIGSLCVTEGLPTKYRLIKAVLAASLFDFYVSGPITIINTYDGEVEIIDNPVEAIKEMEGQL